MRSARLPEPFVFFVDECVKCSPIIDAIQAGLQPNESIEVAPKQTPDEVWLERAGVAGWLCFSKDRRMLKTPNEIRAILLFNVGLFTLGDASAAEHGRLITAGLPLIRRAAQRLDRAFVVRIDKGGDLVVSYEGGERLDPMRRMKPTRSDKVPVGLPKR